MFELENVSSKHECCVVSTLWHFPCCYWAIRMLLSISFLLIFSPHVATISVVQICVKYCVVQVIVMKTGMCLFVAQLLVQFVAILATVCASNPWVLIPTSVIVVVFLLLRAYYLKNSREIKRLEAVGEVQWLLGNDSVFN